MEPDQYNLIWQNTCRRIKTYSNIDVSQVDAFFSRVHPQAFSEGFLMLSADNAFIKSWISNNYTDVIKRALEEEYGVPFNISIEVDPTIADEATTQPSSQSTSVAVPVLAAPVVNPIKEESQPVKQEAIKQELEPEETAPTSLSSNFTFDNFVIGSSNRMAYSMALTVAETPGKTQLNPLFIYGKSGLGKTHLLRSIQNYISKNYPNLKTVYVDAMELLDEYVDAATRGGNKAFSNFRKRYERADVLLVDDVQGLQNKKETLNMVFQIFNRMLDNGKQVVLSADRAPKNIDADERYVSRFNQGGTCNINPPEVETKLGILRNFISECKQENPTIAFDFPNDVVIYIAENSSSNIRELKSAVTKVIYEEFNTQQSDSEKPLTVDKVATLLADHFSGGSLNRLDAEDVQKVVEEYYRVSHADLIGKKRTANITHARQMAMYLCRTLLDISFKAIGECFGRDHSTVMYSVTAVESKIKESREIYEEIEVLRQMIVDR